MHIPVFPKEIIEYLNTGRGGVFLDGTVGMGGHSALLVQNGAREIFAFDRDKDALLNASNRLQGANIKFFHGSFHELSRLLGEPRPLFNGVLLDLGISSAQLDDGSRGFSFSHEGPLDMRMDRSQYSTVSDIVNSWPARDIEHIISTYGEERFARRIAKTIEERRRQNPITSTTQLASLIALSVPRSSHRIHPATRTFQALRIAVNEELEILENWMKDLLPWVAENGRIAIITFHSLEDRIVKHTFRRWEAEGKGKVISKRPLRTTEEEVSANPRSRSAKLRIFEKGSDGPNFTRCSNGRAS